MYLGLDVRYLKQYPEFPDTESQRQTEFYLYLKKAFMFISSYYLKGIFEFILRSIYFATPFGYFAGAKKNLFKFLRPYF